MNSVSRLQIRLAKRLVYQQHRLKATKIHWAELMRKKWHSDRALEYFDDFYKPMFGKAWPSIRLGLLCPIKHCAVINNFSSLEAQEQLMIEIGAYDIKHAYQKHVKKIKRRSTRTEHGTASEQEQTSDEDPSDSESVKSEPTHVNSSVIETDDDSIARSSGNLNQFVPVSNVQGMEDVVDETDFVQHYDPDVEVPFQEEMQPMLEYPEYLKLYCFPRQDISLFPRPQRDSSNLYGYYLLDSASILPALFLDVKPGDSVLDLCSAPGGKAMTITQTLVPMTMVCNDVSESRMKRLKNVFKDYVPNIKPLENQIFFSTKEAEGWGENSVYDKVLVDVPCTNDRISVNEDDNNWFSPRRLKERIALPETQINILYSALLAVKPGGSVVYSTCTLSPVQNDGVVHMALRRVYENTRSNFTIANLNEAIQPFSFLFNFHKNLRYGQLVLPFLPLNSGPMYFCKLIRET